jgi:hypothetical protein
MMPLRSMFPKIICLNSLEYFLLYNKGNISEATIVGNTTAISTYLEKAAEAVVTADWINSQRP